VAPAEAKLLAMEYVTDELIENVRSREEEAWIESGGGLKQYCCVHLVDEMSRCSVALLCTKSLYRF